MPSSVSFTLKDPSGNTVPGTTSFNGADTVDTFTPDELAGAGHDLHRDDQRSDRPVRPDDVTPYTYTFTTSKAFDSGGQCPCAIWPDVGAVRRAPTRPTPARSSWA